LVLSELGFAALIRPKSELVYVRTQAAERASIREPVTI
jgi:hypothetical protein